MYHHLHNFLSLKDFSEIFYNFALGLGALGGVFTAGRAFDFLGLQIREVLDRRNMF